MVIPNTVTLNKPVFFHTLYLFACVLYFPHNEHLTIPVKSNKKLFGLYARDKAFFLCEGRTETWNVIQMNVLL